MNKTPSSEVKDGKKVSSNPLDIMKNINKDITKIQRRKASEKKATMMEGMNRTQRKSLIVS